MRTWPGTCINQRQDPTDPAPPHRNSVKTTFDSSRPLPSPRACRRALPWVVLALLACGSACAQVSDELRSFRHFSIADGLPQSQVYALAQDEAGYLWVGTLAGLARYNGRTFRQYTSTDGLVGNQVEALAPAGDDRIWVGTTAGLCRVGPRIECLDAFNERQIRALRVHAGRLWVGTDAGLIRRAADGSLEVELDEPVSALHALDGTLYAAVADGLVALDADGRRRRLARGLSVTVLRDVGGQLFVGTRQGLFRADGDRLVAVDRGLPTATISELAVDRDGSLLVATFRGLYRLVAPATPDARLQRIRGLASEIVRSLIIDREGVLWVGLDTGLDKLAPSRFLGFDQRSGLLADFVRAIAVDGRGRLWLGSREGLQIVPLNGGRPDFSGARRITSADGLPNERIYAIALIDDDQAWLATNAGVLRWHAGRGVVDRLDRADGLPSDQARSLRRDARGGLWIGTADGVVRYVDGRIRAPRAQRLREAYPINIRVDPAGRVWFATVDQGLLILQPDGELTRLGDAARFGRRAAWDLWPAPDGGAMWVGTNGDGLLKVAPDGRVLRQVTRANGLINDFVWSVMVDPEGAVWAYTTRGLSRVTGGVVVNYDQGDGLLHPEGISTAVARTGGGYLWFASVGGLMRFDASATAPRRAPPPVRIERVDVDGKRIEPGARLGPEGFEITFGYAALSFVGENNLRYRYRLAGLGSNWSETAAYRPITYAGLDPGDYVFEVMAASAGGEWSAPARFAFGVAPPLWQRPGFVLLVAVGLGVLILLGVRVHERGLRHRADALACEVAERTRDLEVANAELRRVATTDPLTGLKNRRFLLEQIGHDAAHVRRLAEARPGADDNYLVFALLDLDSFKEVNDRHGHQAGDALLARIAVLLLEQIRAADYVVRWGGDEFLFVLRAAGMAAGRQLAARVLRRLARERFELDGRIRISGCSCSIGISVHPFDDDEALSWDQVVELADAAVYEAKHAGGGDWVEIVAGSEAAIDDPRGFIAGVRANAADMAAGGRIRIRRGRDGSG